MSGPLGQATRRLPRGGSAHETEGKRAHWGYMYSTVPGGIQRKCLTDVFAVNFAEPRKPTNLNSSKLPLGKESKRKLIL